MLPAGDRPTTSWVHYTTSCNTQSGVPEEGRNNRVKHVKLIEIFKNFYCCIQLVVDIIYIKLSDLAGLVCACNIVLK